MEQEPMGESPPPAATPPPVASPPPSAWEAPKQDSVQGIPGYVYGDLPNRIIALIIDGIVLLVMLIAVGIVLGVAGLSAGFAAGGKFDVVASLIFSIIGLIVSAGYFIFSWTRTRSTIGMRVLGMQVGNAFDGKTLTTEQAGKRWIALWGPSTLSSALGTVPGIRTFLSIAVFIYLVYLLYSTAKSPTKQGFHDKYANSVVVKGTRVA